MRSIRGNETDTPRLQGHAEFVSSKLHQKMHILRTLEKILLRMYQRLPKFQTPKFHALICPLLRLKRHSQTIVIGTQAEDEDEGPPAAEVTSIVVKPPE